MKNYPQAAGVSVQNKNKCGSDVDSAAAPFLTGVKVKERVFVVTALVQTSEKTGWRSRIIGAANIDEAIGRGLRAFEAGEQGANFCVPGAIEISAETLATAGILSAIEVSTGDCQCTKIQQDETCPVGYPSLLCEICDGKGVVPSPRAQALEEAATHLDDEATMSIARSETCSDDMVDEFCDRAEYFKEAASFVRALSSQPVSDRLPQDVINLVIAAREAFDTGVLPDEEEHNLDKALEAFASRVRYENEPDSLPTAPGASE